MTSFQQMTFHLTSRDILFFILNSIFESITTSKWHYLWHPTIFYVTKCHMNTLHDIRRHYMTLDYINWLHMPLNLTYHQPISYTSLKYIKWYYKTSKDDICHQICKSSDTIVFHMAVYDIRWYDNLHWYYMTPFMTSSDDTWYRISHAWWYVMVFNVLCWHVISQYLIRC
jgi:hypothetical protein